MPITTFWSNNEKAIGQTTTASIVAITMAMNYNYKILLLSVDYDNNILEMSFGAQESNKKILKDLGQTTQVNLGAGIEGLMKLANSNRVTPELIHDYTKIIFKNRLEVLYPLAKKEDDSTIEEEDIMEKMINIINNASKYYDQVIIDLKKGKKYEQQLEILKLSDVIVMNVDQRIDTIQEALEMEAVQKHSRKIIWNICKYDKNSKYNSKNLLRTILKKEALFKTPYNTLLSEATQEGRIVELMLKFRTIKGNDEKFEIITSSKELVEAIMMKYKQMRAII